MTQTNSGPKRRQRKPIILLPESMLEAHARSFPHAFDRSATLVLYAIRALAQRVNDHANDWLGPIGLNAAKYNHLAVLYFSGEGGLTLNEVSARIHTSNAAVTSMVATLERDGLVQRVTNPRDGRSVVVTITRKGKALFEKAVPAHYRNISKGMSKLSARERQQLLSLLRKLGAGFEEHFENGS